MKFDEITETAKNEIKIQVGRFLGMLLGTLSASILGNMLTGKGITRARKRIMRAGRGYNNMDHMDKMLVSASSFKQYCDFLRFQLGT